MAGGNSPARAAVSGGLRTSPKAPIESLKKGGIEMGFASGYIRTPTLIGTEIVDSSGTAAIQVAIGASPLGSVVTKLIVTSTAIAAHVVLLTIDDGDQGVLGSVSIPAGAGHAGVAAVELLDALLLPRGGELVLPASDQLKANVEVALDSGETIGVLALGGDF